MLCLKVDQSIQRFADRGTVFCGDLRIKLVEQSVSILMLLVVYGNIGAESLFRPGDKSHGVFSRVC
jgi:hypothetical protein